MSFQGHGHIFILLEPLKEAPFSWGDSARSHCGSIQFDKLQEKNQSVASRASDKLGEEVQSLTSRTSYKLQGKKSERSIKERLTTYKKKCRA